MIVDVIRSNGEREQHDVPAVARRHLANMLETDELDLINLRDGRVMVVDDDGEEREHNEVATRILAATGPSGARPVHGDVAILLNDDCVDTSQTVRLLEYLAGHAVGADAKLLISAARAVEASTTRLLAAIRTLSTNMHEPSAEPCVMCRYVSRVIGEPFGCDAYEHEPATAPDESWQYPTKERVHGRPHW